MKRQMDIQRILEHFKGIRNIQGIKSAKQRVIITKKMRKDNASHLEKELQMSLENSAKNLTKTMIKMNLNKNQVKTKTKAALMCTITTPKRRK